MSICRNPLKASAVSALDPFPLSPILPHFLHKFGGLSLPLLLRRMKYSSSIKFDLRFSFGRHSKLTRTFCDVSVMRSYPRHLWPLRHLSNMMTRHDLANNKYKYKYKYKWCNAISTAAPFNNNNNNNNNKNNNNNTVTIFMNVMSRNCAVNFILCEVASK